MREKIEHFVVIATLSGSQISNTKQSYLRQILIGYSIKSLKKSKVYFFNRFLISTFSETLGLVSKENIWT